METALDVFHTHLKDITATFASRCHPIRLSRSSSFHHHRCFLNRIVLSYHHPEFPIVIQLQFHLSYPRRSRLLRTSH